MKMFLYLMLLAVGVSRVSGLASGAPPSACRNMFPWHGKDAQTTHSPYSFTVAATSYTPGQQNAITVTLTSEKTAFRGVMIQARSTTNCDQQVGTFRLDTSETSLKLIQCTLANDTITHKDTNAKTTKTFYWIPPASSAGPIYFRATVAQSKDVFWTTVESGVVSGGSQISSGTNLTVNCKPPVTQAESRGRGHDCNSASFLVTSYAMMASLFLAVLYLI